MFQVPISEWTTNFAIGVYVDTQEIFSSEIPDTFYTRYLRQTSVYQQQCKP